MPRPVKQLVLKKAARDEYLVLQDDAMVGSIHKVFRATDKPWRWAVDSRHGEASDWAASREDAIAAFRKAWDERA